MWKMTITVVLGVALGAGSTFAAETPDEVPACKTAEINPVTGFVFCIDPLGAAVGEPPADIAPPCNDAQSRGQWSWGPNCRPEIKGM